MGKNISICNNNYNCIDCINLHKIINDNEITKEDKEKKESIDIFYKLIECK